jgi:hypothetical protein
VLDAWNWKARRVAGLPLAFASRTSCYPARSAHSPIALPPTVFKPLPGSRIVSSTSVPPRRQRDTSTAALRLRGLHDRTSTRARRGERPRRGRCLATPVRSARLASIRSRPDDYERAVHAAEFGGERLDLLGLPRCHPRNALRPVRGEAVSLAATGDSTRSRIDLSPGWAGRGIEVPIAVSPLPPSEEATPGPLVRAEYARLVRLMPNVRTRSKKSGYGAPGWRPPQSPIPAADRRLQPGDHVATSRRTSGIQKNATHHPHQTKTA